jgi:hypothetical protein
VAGLAADFAEYPQTAVRCGLYECPTPIWAGVGDVLRDLDESEPNACASIKVGVHLLHAEGVLGVHTPRKRLNLSFLVGGNLLSEDVAIDEAGCRRKDLRRVDVRAEEVEKTALLSQRDALVHEHREATVAGFPGSRW